MLVLPKYERNIIFDNHINTIFIFLAKFSYKFIYHSDLNYLCDIKHHDRQKRAKKTLD